MTADPELRFTWDAKKAAANARKHKVTFAEAVTAFADVLARIQDDPDHSEAEDRLILLGESEHGRLLVVGFTDRGDTVRLISARKATRSERERYEEQG